MAFYFICLSAFTVLSVPTFFTCKAIDRFLGLTSREAMLAPIWNWLQAILLPALTATAIGLLVMTAIGAEPQLGQVQKAILALAVMGGLGLGGLAYHIAMLSPQGSK